MSRLAFVLTIPLLLAAIAATGFANVVGLGFQAEGCRFERTPEVTRNAIFELLLLQLVFGAVIAALAAITQKLLMSRIAVAGRTFGLARWLVTLAVLAIVAATLGQVYYLWQCRGGAVTAVAGSVAGLAAVVALVIAVGAFVVGLAPDRKAG